MIFEFGREDSKKAKFSETLPLLEGGGRGEVNSSGKQSVPLWQMIILKGYVYTFGQVHNLKKLKSRRKELRSSPTRAEKHLWNCLRRKQVQGRKFRRQHSVGNYILDFYCPSHRLAIEVDGAHHSDPAVQRYDNERTRFLSSQGIHVLRFQNEEVLDRTDWVIDCILKRFSIPPPAPSFQEGRFFLR